MAEVQVMLTGDVTQASATRLMSEVTQRVGQGARSLLLAMSTPGGNVYWGVTVYNFLRGLGIEVITHNLGRVDSIGGVIYLAGDRRYTVRQGRFLLHSVAWTFGGQNPSIPEKQLRDTLTNVERDRDTIAAIVAERTRAALEEVRTDMFETRVLAASEAIEYGFVHEIKDEVFEPAQEIVNVGP
jgi:ATP-dependent protease ClpP protease subunit